MREDAIEVPHDAMGYARRACPRCGAHFKVLASRRDEEVLAVALARRVQAIEACLAATPPRHCPYCGESDEAERFWTHEQLRWVDAHARRLAVEVRWRLLRTPLDRLAANPRPTYVPLHPGDRLPAMPPEIPDDMIAIPLPCCGEEQKVNAAWLGPVRCHYCGLVHARQMTRDIGMEMAQLRACRSSADETRDAGQGGRARGDGGAA